MTKSTSLIQPTSNYRHLLLQPFLDESNPLQEFFPERKWALIVPGAVGVALLMAGTMFVMSVLNAKKKKN